MTKGLPASGKSTWARQFIKDNPDSKIVCRDDLRAMLDDGEWSKDNEKFVVAIEKAIVYAGLGTYTMIVADTNLSPKNEVMWKEVADTCKAAFEIKDFTGIPLETCLERDKNRSAMVGEKVILRMYNQFLRDNDE
jgi:predicted kinase